nr:unnamed protein product [Digitaria exilis]
MYAQQLPQHYGGLEEDRDAAHRHGCSGGVPASGEAILNLRETSMDEGECSVLMPCSHWFHEHCIFSWLQISHVCPLCRFALPT